jgi:hypothetical protein
MQYLVSHPKERTTTEGAKQQIIQDNIWAQKMQRMKE